MNTQRDDKRKPFDYENSLQRVVDDINREMFGKLARVQKALNETLAEMNKDKPEMPDIPVVDEKEWYKNK